MTKNKEPDMKHIEDQLKDWEWQWVNGKEVYTTTPNGYTVAKVKALHKKYFPLVSKN